MNFNTNFKKWTSVLKFFENRSHLGDSGNPSKRIVCKAEGTAVKLIKIGHLSPEPTTSFRPKIMLKKMPEVTAN